MKKFEIKKKEQEKWLITHNESPKFTCLFEDKKFNSSRKIIGLSDPQTDTEQIQVLQKMEKWLKQYHKEKITD